MQCKRYPELFSFNQIDSIFLLENSKTKQQNKAIYNQQKRICANMSFDIQKTKKALITLISFLCLSLK